jgi:U4/U6.U5 tri-snRNP-associated protein 2
LVSSLFQFYVLPDGYKVEDPSLSNIIHVLNPRFTPSQIASLNHLPSSPASDLSSSPYLPGYIGLNNIKANDYQNVILHSLLHIPPIRDFLLSPTTPQLQPEKKPTELVKKLAELCRKVWNPELFKAQVSPHEFLQEVGLASEGRFKITKQGDPIEFLGWLLNRLHRDLGGSKKKNSSKSCFFKEMIGCWSGAFFGHVESLGLNRTFRFVGIIYQTFQGDLKIETQKIVIEKDAGGNEKPRFDISRGKSIL